MQIFQEDLRGKRQQSYEHAKAHQCRFMGNKKGGKRWKEGGRDGGEEEGKREGIISIHLHL